MTNYFKPDTEQPIWTSLENAEIYLTVADIFSSLRKPSDLLQDTK